MTFLVARIAAAAAALIALSGAALAHTGAGATSGFAHGFVHPIGGLDHVLAMVAVGLYAALLGGRALWLVPATFVGAMALGGALGMAGLALPYGEIGIALSVIALGLAVALRISLPVLIATALAGLFAIFHGHAHGAEMPRRLGPDLRGRLRAGDRAAARRRHRARTAGGAGSPNAAAGAPCRPRAAPWRLQVSRSCCARP